MDPQLPRQGLQEDVAKLPPPLTIPQSLHPKCLAIKKHGAIFKESKMQQRTKSNTKTYQNNEREKRKVSLIEGNQVTIGNFHTKLVFCKTHIIEKKGMEKSWETDIFQGQKNRKNPLQTQLLCSQLSSGISSLGSPNGSTSSSNSSLSSSSLSGSWHRCVLGRSFSSHAKWQN